MLALTFRMFFYEFMHFLPRFCFCVFLCLDLGFIFFISLMTWEVYFVCLLPNSAMRDAAHAIMQQVALINRGGKHYSSCEFARSVQSSIFPKHVERKPEPEVISAMGSALPLFQSFPVFLAAAVPSHCASSALITASLTKSLPLPHGPG